MTKLTMTNDTLAYTTLSGNVVSFSKEKLLEILTNWEGYMCADNLPKWLVMNGDVKTFNQAKKLITLKAAELV